MQRLVLLEKESDSKSTATQFKQNSAAAVPVGKIGQPFAPLRSCFYGLPAFV